MTATGDRYILALSAGQMEIWRRAHGPAPAKKDLKAAREYERAVYLVKAWKRSAQHHGLLDYGDTKNCRITGENTTGAPLWAPGR